MPEVRDALERHLDIAADPSLAVRSVYGIAFSDLVFFDGNWAQKNVGRIFPTEPNLTQFRSAAWDTYVVFCRPFSDVFEILREEYAHAITLIGSRGESGKNIPSPDSRLADHLFAFFWSGQVGLEEPGDLLPAFYGDASDSLRAHVIDMLGSALSRESGKVSPAILQRLKALWEWRLRGAQEATDKSAYAEEMDAFGEWFTCGKFDEVWALDNLRTALRISGKAERERSVLERLAELAPRFPQKTFDCLRLIVESASSRPYVILDETHARPILIAARDNGDQQLHEAAIDLIHRLGSLGHIRYRDLLPGKDGAR
jgi:hypothetical protein